MINDLNTQEISNKSEVNFSYKQLKKSISENNINKVKAILDSGEVDPSKDNYPVTSAAMHGHIEILKLLLNDERIDPIAFNDKQFQNQCLVKVVDNIEILKLLLEDKRVNPSKQNQILVEAVKEGNLEVVKLLLNDKRVHPSRHSPRHNLFYAPIVVAARLGNLDIFKLLHNDKRANPNINDNAAIRFIANTSNHEMNNSYREILNILLNDKRVDPSANDNEAIKNAVDNENFEIVELLLNDKRVDPNEAIKSAIDSENFEIVELLLNDKRVDPNHRSEFYPYYTPITIAASLGNLDIFKLLLNDKRIDPSINDNAAIQSIAKISDRKMNNSYREILNILLNDKRVDPSANDNEAIKSAIDSENFEIVELLLKDKRIDPSNFDIYRLKDILFNCEISTVNKLLKNENLDLSDSYSYVRDAELYGKVELMNSLFKKKKIKNEVKKQNPKLYEKLLKSETSNKIANFFDEPKLITHSVTKHDKLDEIAILGLIKLGEEPTTELVKQTVSAIAVQNKLTDTKTLVEGATLQIPTLEMIKQTIVEETPVVKPDNSPSQIVEKQSPKKKLKL